MQDVVSSTHEITIEWLNDKLKKSGRLKTQVTELEITTIGEGVGLMGELARLTLSYAGEEDLPTTMIAKCAAQNDNIQVAQVLDFYNREVNFYNKMSQSCGLKVPDSYYAAVDQETYHCVILMQDLGDVSPNDQIIGASEVEAFSAIDDISRMHARFWGKVDTPEFDWIYRLMGTHSCETLQNMVYMPAVESCIEKFDSFFDDESRALVRKVGERFPEVWSSRISNHETLVHGDYRQDNFLYTDDEGSAVVMDWQISAAGKGIFDFSYFVCQSLTSKRRKELEEPLLRRYVEGLKQGGVDDYDYETAFEDYRFMIMGCLVYPITVCGTLDLSNERGRALGEAMLERNLTAIKELNCAALL